MAVCAVLVLCGTGCSREAETAQGPGDTASVPASIPDKPLAVFQEKLLGLSFETATLIPVKPHIKDRSRMQEKVVEACLKLDQPTRAMAFIERIDNWRRGAAYADWAFYQAERGSTGRIPHYLDLARQIALAASDWRRDRIKVKIARTYALLGEHEQAEAFEDGVEDSEKGKVAGVRAGRGSEDSFDDMIQRLDELIETGHVDVVRNALYASAELFNRFYDTPAYRDSAQERIKNSWDVLPVVLKIDLLVKLTGFALDHGDNVKANKLIDEAQQMMDNYQWRLRYRIPLMAQLAQIRFRAGNKEKALADADRAGELFDKDGRLVVNIYRAETLLPLAEAYQSMGEMSRALAVYKRAVEASVQNPNSRPRAEDLSAVCSSMAVYKAAPDEALWSRILQIKETLGDPW